MISFTEFITEKVLSIGLNSEQEHLRGTYRKEIHDILRKSYSHPLIGGYGGLESGSKEESDAIHHDIDNSIIKAHRRNGKITAVELYKKQHGRKSIACGTDGTEQGKKDFMKTELEDHEQKRAWGEASGGVEHIRRKIGVPVISTDKVKEILGKEIHPEEDKQHYSRKIGGHMHTKVVMGHPKVDK